MLVLFFALAGFTYFLFFFENVMVLSVDTMFFLPEKLAIRRFNNFPLIVPVFQVSNMFVQHLPVLLGGSSLLSIQEVNNYGL